MIALYIYFLINAFLVGVVVGSEEKTKSKYLVKSALLTFLFGIFLYIWITIKTKK